MKTLRVGIAGYGVIGPKRHRYIDLHPNMKVVAISDQKFQENNMEHHEIRRFRNYFDLLKCDLDALFVCLPNDLAPTVTIKGLQKGLHVFCEKPPGRTVEDIKNVIEEEKLHPNLKLKYGFNHRYHDSVREALKIVSSGKLGRVINLRGVYGKSAFLPWPRPSNPELNYAKDRYWRTSKTIAGGGILLDQGIHMLDLMRAFAGDFSDVKSIVKNNFWNHDVEDNAYAIMETTTGVVAMLHSTATQWRHKFVLEISLTEGSLILSGILSGTKSYGQERLTVIHRHDEDNGNPSEQTTNYVRDHSWRDEVFEFATSIVNDQPITVGNSNDALKTMELVYKIYSSDDKWNRTLISESKNQNDPSTNQIVSNKSPFCDLPEQGLPL